MISRITTTFSARQFASILHTEGKTTFLVPSDQPVFYNPDQRLSRDISVSILRSLLNPNSRIRALDAFSATGIRSVRYLREVPGVSQVTINDISDSAVACIRENLKLNNIDVGHAAIVTQKDAKSLLADFATRKERFDLIDLDPYGSAIECVKPALNCISPGGLLFATFTDAAVLQAPKHVAACRKRYGVVPPFRHGKNEGGLRALLYSIHKISRDAGTDIEPLLCLYSGYYYRLFLRVVGGAVHDQATSASVESCYMCQHYSLAAPQAQEGKIGKCPVCGSKTKTVGPIWAAALSNREVTEKVIKDWLTRPDAKSEYSEAVCDYLRSVVAEHKHRVRPLGVYINRAFADLGMSSVPLRRIRQVRLMFTPNRKAMNSAGYVVYQSPLELDLLKTDAVSETVYDTLKSLRYTWEPQKDSKVQYRTTIRQRPLKVQSEKRPSRPLNEEIWPRYAPLMQNNLGPRKRPVRDEH